MELAYEHSFKHNEINFTINGWILGVQMKLNKKSININKVH